MRIQAAGARPEASARALIAACSSLVSLTFTSIFLTQASIALRFALPYSCKLGQSRGYLGVDIIVSDDYPPNRQQEETQMATTPKRTAKAVEEPKVNAAKEEAAKALDKLSRAGGMNSQWTAAWEAYKAAQ